MSYHEKIGPLANDAEQLEQVYRQAMAGGEGETFARAMAEMHAADPDNILLAAWFYRLNYAAAQIKGFVIAWGWAIPLAAANGLLYWILSDDQRFMVELVRGRTGTTYGFIPTLVLLAAPLAAAFVLTYLTAVGPKKWLRSVALALLPLAAGGYVLLTYSQAGTRPFQEQYLTLMAMHLPLLAWSAVGGFLLFERRDPANRFAFLIKSLEVFIMGGLFAIAGGLFTAISTGLFAALDIDFPFLVQRLFFAGGGGLIPVMAVAVIYNPAAHPTDQPFEEGLSKLIALLMRIMLPLALLVLVVYVAFIPFNFWEPFDNRDVLIIYNGMLFAVIALLVGATPIRSGDLSPRLAAWLRWAIVAVATLAFLVSLYALAAIVYRTALDRLTPNRLTFIGWNVVNIGLLALLLWRQLRASGEGWLGRFYRAYSAGTVAYAVWSLAVILVLPWLFGINEAEIERLPAAVQAIIYEQADPILLKCRQSPHIYLLQDGQKRWVKDIETFNDQGYVWRDVEFIPCDDLRTVPDGVPIPADAGGPPQP